MTFVKHFVWTQRHSSAPKCPRFAHTESIFLSVLILFVADSFAQPKLPMVPNAPPLSGVVIGNDGTRVQAIITAMRLSLPSAGTRTETASDGSFTLSGVPDGKYQLCAVDKSGNYLDPCTWSSIPATVNISASKPISGYQLAVTKGVALQVRLTDVGQVLAPISGSNQPAATLIVAVQTLHHTIQPFVLSSTDSVGRTLQSVVPTNTTVLVKLFGKGVSLADPTGNSLNAALGASYPIQTTQAPQTVTFTVTGAAAKTGTTSQKEKP